MNSIDTHSIKEFLDEQYQKYCHSSFIEDDPIQVPHLFSTSQNREISGLFAATFAWGQRKTIIAKSKELMSRMDNDPYRFVVSHEESDLSVFDGFRHRTFGPDDAKAFVRTLADIYRTHGSLDGFMRAQQVDNPLDAARALRQQFVKIVGSDSRSLRHVANVDSGAAAKRLNMYFRWMVRQATEGVDFGLWSCMASSALLIPLDLHVGNVSRELGLLVRKQNDLKAVLELTHVLQSFDATDPVKYDFALFSIGANKIEEMPL